MATPNRYARAYQTQAILTASPGQLVLMLYDGALRFMGQAKDAFGLDEDNVRRIEMINTALIRTQNILAELQTGLNLEAGGEHAANLDRLYDYYLRRLLECNVTKKIEPLLEVERLVSELRDGWAEMLRKEGHQHFEATRGVA